MKKVRLFILKKQILPIINGKAIIIEYNLQSGNKAIHNGRFFNISCKCKMKTLSHKSIMGQVIVVIEKIINIANKSNVFFIVIYHILHNDLPAHAQKTCQSRGAYGGFFAF